MRYSLLQLTFIHLKEFVRQPAVFFWGFLFPVAMAWVLGVAFSNQSEPIHRIGILVESKSDSPTAVQWVQEALDKQNQLDVELVPMTSEEAIKAVKKGEIQLYLENSFTATSDWIFHFDPRNKEAERSYLYLKSFMMDLSDQVDSPNTVRPRFTLQEFQSIGTRYIDFLVPGMIGMGIMNSCLWGMGYGLVELRIRKLLRRMVASPMKKWEFLFGYFLSRLAATCLESAFLFGFVFIYFDSTVTGSWPALLAVFLSGNCAFAGLAVFLASRTDNTRVGNGLINTATLPMMILSGVFFSYRNFPEWCIHIIQMLPLTRLVDSLRGIFNLAYTMNDCLSSIVVMLSTGLVFSLLGLKVFRWH